MDEKLTEYKKEVEALKEKYLEGLLSGLDGKECKCPYLKRGSMERDLWFIGHEDGTEALDRIELCAK